MDPATGDARARSFSDGLSDLEDPATGAAAGPLCAYVAAEGGTDALTIVQGVEMGRPSRLEARMEGDRVRVGGNVVVLVEGTVSL